MAKIKNLDITTIKFKDGSITKFFEPYSGSLGTNRYVDVEFDAYSPPAMIWVQSESGTTNLYYDYGGSGQELVLQFSGKQYMVVGDSRSAGTRTYALQGTGTAQITGAMMRFR